MDTEYASRPTELVIHGAEVDFLDPKLSEQRGAHDTRLNRDVERGLIDDRSVHPRRGMELLPVGEKVAIPRINVTPCAGFYVRELCLVGLDAQRHFGSRWLDGGIGLGWLKIGGRGIGQQGRDSHEFGVSRAVSADIRRIHSLGDDPIFIHKHAPNGCLVCLESQSSLIGTVSPVEQQALMMGDR